MKIKYYKILNLTLTLFLTTIICGCISAEKYSMYSCSELLQNGDYQKAFDCFNSYAIEYPENSFIRYMRGYLYIIYKGDLKKALEDYTASIKYYENLESEVKKIFLLENVYNERGLLYDSLKQYNNAITDFKKSIELEMINPNALNNMGWTYFHAGEYAKSIETFNKSIYIKKDDPNPYARKGFVFHKTGDLDSGIFYFNKSIELKGNYWEVQCALGDIYYAQTKYSDAILNWEKAIELLGADNTEITNTIKAKIEEALKK